MAKTDSSVRACSSCNGDHKEVRTCPYTARYRIWRTRKTEKKRRCDSGAAACAVKREGDSAWAFKGGRNALALHRARIAAACGARDKEKERNCDSVAAARAIKIETKHKRYNAEEANRRYSTEVALVLIFLPIAMSQAPTEASRRRT